MEGRTSQKPWTRGRIEIPIDVSVFGRTGWRFGKLAKYGQSTEKRVVALLGEPPRKGYSQWNIRLFVRSAG